MTITHLLSRFSGCGFLLVALIISSCNQPEFKSQRNMDFNHGWRFLEDSIPEAQIVEFDDQSWRLVSLPHDWSVEDHQIRDSTHTGPFVKDLPLGHDVGYLRGGTGWYRKEFVVENENAGKEVILHFDGVMSEMKLWVNGTEIGEHVYGYTPFYFNITDFLNGPGEKNIIALQVYKPMENSRWFAGAGIYRSVEISYLEPVHVDVWGLAVKVDVKDDGEAGVELDLNIENHGESDVEIEIKAEIMAPDGTVMQWPAESATLPQEGKKRISVPGVIDHPALWDIDDPRVYTAKILVFEQGRQIDEYTQEFGIRTIEYSVDGGLLLNGEKILLKGGCMHHDNGLLGAAAFQEAEERRVRTMKDNGFNSIRTSHNPPSKYFLEACDKLGMLVIDEAFDMWVKPKRRNDYHQYFQEWWKKDLESMVMRDRNHPSIIMWSFGNEVQERADSSGVVIAKNCIEAIRAIDDTRPITQAVCGFWDNPGKEWDDSAPAFETLDIGGYNYKWDQYKSDHEKYPDRIMFGSESVPKEAFENWQLVEELPYVIGDFVWTGMDYIGESGIGYSEYPNPDDERFFLMPWPTYISWCGDIDIIGNKKPQSYYRDILWGESNLEILVHEPNTSENEELTSFWGWPNEVPNWNWEGHEGEVVSVNVYSTFPRVRLELNGEVVGEESVSEESKFTATFNVPYAPGELKAIGLIDGVVKDEKVLQSSGELASLQLMAESTTVEAGKRGIVYVQVSALDENGILVNRSSDDLSVVVEGAGEVLAAGNANPKLEGSIQDDKMKLFNGKGLIVVRSTGDEGTIRISVKSGELSSESVTINAIK
jgi:beta-galactosidase